VSISCTRACLYERGVRRGWEEGGYRNEKERRAAGRPAGMHARMHT
jgi:hypothetical protein